LQEKILSFFFSEFFPSFSQFFSMSFNRPRRKRVVVKYKYDGVGTDRSLPVNIGEKLVVAKEFDGLAFGENLTLSGGGGSGRGWFVAARSSNGEKGYVPKSFVDILVEDDQKQDNAKRKLASSSSGGAKFNSLTSSGAERFKQKQKLHGNKQKRRSVSDEMDVLQGQGKVRLLGSQKQKFSRPLPPQRRNQGGGGGAASPSKRNTELISRGISSPSLPVGTPPGRGRGGARGRGTRGRGAGGAGRGRGGGATTMAPVDRDICLVCEKKPLGADRIAAAGRSWHRACFKCTECGSSIALGRENVFREHLFCDKCHRGVSGVSGYGYSNSVQARKTVLLSRSVTSPALTGSNVCQCGATSTGAYCSNCGRDLR
jgi:LIM domain